jgi:hypothetical protein
MPHPNPYYVLHQTEQDALAVPRAYGHDVSKIDPSNYKANRPLGTENIDLNALDIEAMQVKNTEVNEWVGGIMQGIQEKVAPGAVASLEDQILALQFLGADPRQIASLQDKIDKREATQQLNAQLKAQSDLSAPQSGVYVTGLNSDTSSPRITINPRIILQDAQSTPPSASSDDISLSKTYIKDLMPDISADPHSASIAAAHASRSTSGVHVSAEEPLFRHDPLQNLPTGRSAAKSASANPNLIRSIPGLCTGEQLAAYIRSGVAPPDFPVTNPTHLQLLLSAIKVAKTQPVETDSKSYRSRHRFSAYQQASS